MVEAANDRGMICVMMVCYDDAGVIPHIQGIEMKDMVVEMELLGRDTTMVVNVQNSYWLNQAILP